MLRSFIVLSFILVSLPAAAEPTTLVVHPPWEADARAALVHVETAWTTALGVMISERRAYATYGFLDTGRDVEVSFDGGRPVVAEARVYEHDYATTWVLDLERSVGAKPLTLSSSDVTPGTHVFAFERRGDDLQLVEVLVGAIGNGHFTLAAHAWQLVSGSPVFDGDGKLIGLLGWNLEVVPASLIGSAKLEERGLSVLPLVGYRFGYEHGGFLEDAATFDMDLGVTLGDRVSLVGRLGLGFGGPTADTLRLDEQNGEGFGRVALSDSLEMRLGAEARYRFYLGGGEMPLYLDLAAGYAATWVFQATDGPTFRSTQPGCDPGRQACPLRIDPTTAIPEPLFANDLTVGADFRWGPLSIGYRFMPGLGAGPATHQFLFGASFF